MGIEVEAILTGDSPCDGCENSPRCAAEHLACSQFALFSFGKARSEWSAAAMVPTRAKYDRLFN